jgi:hypothetical protein
MSIVSKGFHHDFEIGVDEGVLDDLFREVGVLPVAGEFSVEEQERNF